MALYGKREKIWHFQIEKYLRQLPTLPRDVYLKTLDEAYQLGNDVTEAFLPLFPWDEGPEKQETLNIRGAAQKRIRERIEKVLHITLP